MKRNNREKINKVILSVIIAVVMVSSIIGFLYGTNGNENILKYDIKNKTYSFIRENNMYILAIDKQKIGFYYLPFDINFNMSDEISDKIRTSKAVYITFNPETAYGEYIDVARFDLTNGLAGKNIYPVNGITANNAKYNLPIVNCENATSFIPVIFMKDSNQTSLSIENNCIKFEGKNIDFIKFRDLVLYKLYGIL